LFALVTAFSFFSCSQTDETAIPTAGNTLTGTVDIAKIGGIKVDDETGCGDTEENSIGCGGNIVIWYNAGSLTTNSFNSGFNFCFRMFNSNGLVAGPTTFQFDGNCFPSNGVGFWFENGGQIANAPCASGSYRVKVTQGSCGSETGNIGSDSFTVP
jgi:hypothetical protein